MSSKEEKPPTSKEEAAARCVRPPPEKYDPDEFWEWSITEVLAWIIWREIEAVRNECDDYRSERADKLSGWGELRLRACLKNISPQAAIKELWKTAGEGRIKATALRYEDAKTIDRDLIDIPARHWARLKPVDDPLTGKAMLIDDQGRVYREVKFLRLDGKELWLKSPPLPEEHGEWPSRVALAELMESTMWDFSRPYACSDSHRSEVDALEHAEKPEPEPTRPAEPELLESKARPIPESPQWKRTERYIKKHCPTGPDGISTSAIHRKFVKDKDLEAELEREGGIWGVPSPTVIDRVLGRRLK